jgi:lipopolysaccharide biosynthesis glycosyltransferase
MNWSVINICFASTCNRYLKYVASLLESLYDHLNTKYTYNIFFLCDKPVDDQIKSKLFYKNFKNLKIISIQINEYKEFSKYINLKDKSKVLLYRLILSNYINEDKVLFMDCDTIINWDISELYFTDLWSNLIWASKDCVLRDISELKNNNINKYFNAGIQLINLKKWKKERIWERALDFLNKNCKKLPFYDQDTLNIILKDNRLQLSPKWNWINISTFTNKWTQYTKQEFYDLRHPIIVHYAENYNRPRWWLICVHPKRYLYYKYIFRTKYWDISDVYKFPLRLLTSNYLCRTIYKIARLLFHK